MRSFNLAGLVAVFCLPSMLAQADDMTDDEGKYWVQLRYRYEFVDQDPFAKDANASTLRARVGAETAKSHGWNLLLEADYITEAWSSDFNDGVTQNPDRLQYPAVIDPKGADLNQGFVQYTDDWGRVRIGRQRINFDNQRFVGAVGWRQHEQTFDALGVQFGGNQQPWRVDYAYVNQVKRIFGQSNPGGRHDHDTHLLNGGYSLGDWGDLGAYYYQIDNDDAAAQSTQTFGARWKASRPWGDNTVSWLVEAATQSDFDNNPVDYSAEYFRLDGNINFGNVKAGLGYEVLSGDANKPGASFRTPLATLHAFNGWADAFLATPDQGLQDTFASVSGSIEGWNWAAIYHDFSAESGSGGFGDELDMSLSRKFGSHVTGLLKYAHYQGGSLGQADRDKIWLMMTANW
ncbi:MAG: hypothetical protein DHS20C11_38270 [Lysobacteraceae bacterium]|nr:MAG: hypothetical protein DHS20C11_38270 [Xanthomonadaceae bacterium]